MISQCFLNTEKIIKFMHLNMYNAKQQVKMFHKRVSINVGAQRMKIWLPAGENKGSFMQEAACLRERHFSISAAAYRQLFSSHSNTVSRSIFASLPHSPCHFVVQVSTLGVVQYIREGIVTGVKSTLSPSASK